ncbi:MAG: rod shape-determining protein [Deltaproteobacteria bacterium]|nr:rod shape-determining protein [Deltaproteobacteria bacterium]
MRFSNDIAVDLGTANTLVCVKDKGIVINEPSVVAVKNDGKGGKKVLAVGKEAKKMVGRTPSMIEAVKPMKDGVIADFEITEKMLRYFIKKARNKGFLLKPRVVIAVPHGITQVEERAVRDSARSAGAREVYLIEEPMASAIGVGLPIQEAMGNMIIDIGGGTTEVAVISLGGIVCSQSIRSGGVKMDAAIVNYIKRKYNIFIGENAAEQVKIKWGSAYPTDMDDEEIEVKGIDLVSGIPTSVKITVAELREALHECLMEIVSAVKDVLEKTPPELASDIVDKGIVVIGGGALIKGIDKLFQQETLLPIVIGEDPLEAVVKGAGKVLENMDLLKEIALA